MTCFLCRQIICVCSHMRGGSSAYDTMPLPPGWSNSRTPFPPAGWNPTSNPIPQSAPGWDSISFAVPRPLPGRTAAPGSENGPCVRCHRNGVSSWVYRRYGLCHTCYIDLTPQSTSVCVRCGARLYPRVIPEMGLCLDCLRTQYIPETDSAPTAVHAGSAASTRFDAPAATRSSSSAHKFYHRIFLPDKALSAITCTICLSPLNVNTEENGRPVSTLCGHSFHENCLLQSISSSNECPNCRSSLA